LESNLFREGYNAARLRVLIADDIQETRRNTRLMLAMNPEVDVVATARNGLQAVELAEKHRPDLVILDINMPEMDGLTAFEEMKKFNPEIACIIISAEKESQTLRKAMAAGAREYLIKPFTVDELNLAVYKVCQLVVKKRKETLQVRETLRGLQAPEADEAELEQLANEYIIRRRADDTAVFVFERLAANPNCELRWLRVLAMVYTIRQEWGKLTVLATRLDQRTRKL
jgi:YesN/AraC family two-component response regulator